ncbi:MAG: DNA-processing protein DprA [Betaproteobacteria bacterium]|nr:DNA-processing protein DprA [Betaproteobacteria bacterium]MDH5536106.1 DNA-processing protein DprA [Betaproteobacteria bacterium]
MSDDPGLASWLQLTLTPGLGAAAIRGLLAQFGLPENIFAAPREQLQRVAGPAVAALLRGEETAAAVQHALRWLEAPRHAVVTLADAGYPRLLLEIADPPPLLYAVGRLELLGRSALAIVGSRNATAQGIRNAQQFAHAFSATGLTIVSGLAMGIDAAAHAGGLAGEGSTIAVLGTGVDVTYPRQNAALASRIAETGLLLSEFPLGTAGAAHHFPRRNRLISGLAQGCLVVEAAIASGSLITARAAAEQGREVFAIPGSIHSPLSKGCHALIKQGAKLVESAEDVLAELTSFRRTGFASTHASTPVPAAEDPLLAHMGFDPVDIDSLCARSGLTAERVSADLLRLELGGRVAALPGGMYQRLN